MDDIVIIRVEESGERIDALLARNVDDLSRSAAQRLIEDSCVLVNGQVPKKNYKCLSGDRI